MPAYILQFLGWGRPGWCFEFRIEYGTLNVCRMSGTLGRKRGSGVDVSVLVPTVARGRRVPFGRRVAVAAPPPASPAWRGMGGTLGGAYAARARVCAYCVKLEVRQAHQMRLQRQALVMRLRGEAPAVSSS